MGDNQFILCVETPVGTLAAAAPLTFENVEDAYCDVCHAIPSTAAQLLRQGIDPTLCRYTIANAAGEQLMEVPFTEVLRPNASPRPATASTSFVPFLSAAPSGIAGRTAALRAMMENERTRSRRAVLRGQLLAAESKRLADQVAARLPVRVASPRVA